MLENGIEAFSLRDDAAVLDLPTGGPLVVSVDSVVEGVHVDLALCSPGDVGWKALMGALSDLAAMGAAPLAALVALCVPGGAGDGELALGVMAGVAEASAAAGCPVVGGDVSEGSEVMVAVTVLGTVDPGGPAPVSRAGAQPGDAVFVTGPCGGSAAGLRVLRAAGARCDADGTEADLACAYRRPVARSSRGSGRTPCRGPRHDRRVGRPGPGPPSTGRRLAGRLRARISAGRAGATLDEALGGGEDYELLVAVDHGRIEALSSAFAAGGLRPPLPLGVLTGDPEVRRLGAEPVDRVGWQHRLG